MANYVFSIDGEMYHDDGCASVDEAIEAAFEYWGSDYVAECSHVYVGIRETVRAGDYLSTDRLVEDMAERAYDDVGESSEDWLYDVKTEHATELDMLVVDLINAWADTHGYQPDFWRVCNVQEIPITEELVAKYSTENEA